MDNSEIEKAFLDCLVHGSGAVKITHVPYKELIKMPKATLEFNIPEESEEHLTALNGNKYRCIIGDMHEWLRHKVKREDITIVRVEEVVKKLVELEDEYGVDV